MFGYPFRSWSSTLVGVAFGVFVSAVVLSFLCIVLRGLLIVIMGISLSAVLLGVWVRWLLFRFRGW
jgi:hypothetical protein